MYLLKSFGQSTKQYRYAIKEIRNGSKKNYLKDVPEFIS